MAADARRSVREGSHDAASARHPTHLRRLNVDRVLSMAIEHPGTFTRAELIEASGLSAPTIGSVTAHLIRTGVVKDLGTGPSSGGRRPALMEFNARHGFIAVMDIGPTRTARGGRPPRRAGRAHHRRHQSIPRAPQGAGPVAHDLSALLERAKVPAGRPADGGGRDAGYRPCEDGVVLARRTWTGGATCRCARSSRRRFTRASSSRRRQPGAVGEHSRGPRAATRRARSSSPEPASARRSSSTASVHGPTTWPGDRRHVHGSAVRRSRLRGPRLLETWPDSTRSRRGGPAARRPIGSSGSRRCRGGGVWRCRRGRPSRPRA